MMRPRVASFLLLVFGLATAASLRADYVLLHDGSKIVGKIERIAGGKLVVNTDFAGKLEFETAKVKAIAVDESVNVALQSGDRLVGPIQSMPDGSKSVVKSAVGDVPLATDGVANLWREDGESPEAIAAKVELEKYKPHWLYKVELGANQTEGNTDTKALRGRLDIDRKTEADLLKFYAQADYAEENDNRTRNEYLGGIKYEHMFRPRWYWYTRGELEHDEFENLDLRATAAAGVGYYWIKKEVHELKTRLGGGYRHESFDSGNTRDDAIADLGLDYRLDVTHWMQFTHSTTYTPSLEEFNDYRLDFDTAMLFPLRADQWKLKIGMQNKYNSNPDGDLDRLDNTYYANILLEIKR